MPPRFGLDVAGTPIRISRRRGGRMQVTQGRSFILLDRAEIASLIRDAQQILDTPDDGPARADTAMTIDDNT